MVDGQTFTFEDPNQQARVVAAEQRVEKKRKACEAKGGTWNASTQTCILPPKDEPQTTATTKITGIGRQLIPKDEATGPTGEFKSTLGKPKVALGGTGPIEETQEEFEARAAEDRAAAADPRQQVIFDEFGQATGVIQPSGSTFLGADVANQATLQQGAVAADAQQQPDLSGQVGQFGQLGISQTQFDGSALAGATARGLIPSILTGVGTMVAAGFLGKTALAAGATGGPTAALALGALAFAGSMASNIFSEMKGQRTDNTNAQQRVLDEGKQVLSDWVTFAEANPSQKELALAGFNQQLALIDQAHRQMKLDTSQDLLAFENAIPNLAEFDAFYSPSGERDVYSREMAIAMLQQSSVDTRMIALINRRGK